MAARSGSASFSFSGLLHGSVLAWLMLSTPTDPEPRQSIEQVIQPHESRIIWYHLKDRLPDISPAPATTQNRQPRASANFRQSIVSGAKNDAQMPQRIWMPAPEVPILKAAPLPNMLAMAPKAPARRFIPPPVAAPAPVAGPTIPEAPAVSLAAPHASLALDAAIHRAPPKQWVPPATAPVKGVRPKIPEAPAVSLATPRESLSLDPAIHRAPPKQWTPPATAPAKNVSPTIPEALDASLVIPLAPLALDAAIHRAPPKSWTPPATAPARSVSPTIPEAPAVSLATPLAPLVLDAASRRAPPKSWTPPAAPAVATAPVTLTDAPDVPHSADRMLDTSLAIVGLNPAKISDFTPPAGSREAGFSAGPEIHRDGEAQSDQPATLVIPGLLARGGLKDSQPTLMAGVLPMPRRDVMAAIRAVMEPPPAPELRAARVSNAPDPRLEGRAVYSIAIQMPNITSYYGSWLVWFAERDRVVRQADITVRPPAPTRKVDPKYIAAAASEHVEGVVRLFAVIRKDGSIDSVALIRHLDDRLDRSAAEALAKWQFEPATRDGIPIDVDAIFEIPFRLAPRTAK